MIGHLASFEQMLIEVLGSLPVLAHLPWRAVPGAGSVLEDRGMPTVERFGADPDGFNEQETLRRRELSRAEVWQEYETAHPWHCPPGHVEQAMAPLARVPEEMRRQTGILRWYGPEYDLEDFIVYTFYGHKWEHSAHISLFRDQVTGVID